MARPSIANLVLAGVPLVLWAIACGSSGSNPNKPKGGDCPVGSEGCPCTSGKACDPGLVCFDPLCFRPNAASGAGGRGGNGGGAPSGGTIAGPDGGGSPGAGGSTAPDGSTGGAGNADAGGATASATCPFPKDGPITPAEQSDTLGQSKDKIDAKFAGGALVELDSKTCTVDPSPAALAKDWSTYLCHDAYVCGGCPVFVISPKDASSVGQWFLLGSNTATYGATPGCPELSASYTICAPDCAGKECGDDGCGSFCGSGCGKGRCCNKTDQCVNDGCSQCLDSCFGACGSDPTCSSSCCTGSGCQCEGACPGPC